MSIEVSHQPRTGATVDGPAHTSPVEVAATVAAAAGVFPAVSTASPQERRRWLGAVADALDAASDELVALADEETALGEARLSGELMRGAVNMRYYASVGEEGSWLRARVQTIPGGGTALVERARQRPHPILVYAEMGTVNPVLVTPAATARIEDIAQEFVASFTLGAGQYCTKPGLMLAPHDSGATHAVATHAGSSVGVWLLTEGIATAYRDGVKSLVDAGGEVIAAGATLEEGYAAQPTVLRVDTTNLRPGSRLPEECFGPVALVAEYTDVDEALAILGRMPPSLAGTVYGDGDADPDIPRAVAQMATQTGRVIVDGASTGVACVDAMHHGGPCPSTSNPSATSVGAEALGRFTRPVAFQNVPDAALPPALQDANPWNIQGRHRTRTAE